MCGIALRAVLLQRQEFEPARESTGALLLRSPSVPYLRRVARRADRSETNPVMAWWLSSLSPKTYC